MFGAQGDITSTIVWFLFFIIFMLFAPRLMLAQTILKLEKEVMKFEGYAKKARSYIEKEIKDKNAKKRVKHYMDFFTINPIETDPYGIIKKIDHIVRNSEDRLKYFVNQLSPKLPIEKKEDMKMALIAGITTNQIAKIVRDFLEKVKKYKMYQLAIILQMQLPIIDEMARASLKATGAFLNQMPIGDSIGPLVAAKLIKGKPKLDKQLDFAYYKTKLFGRPILICKAMGPGGRLGQPGRFLEKYSKGYKKIITIDAAGKLEGEKTGSVAEGVGVAMGGIVDRYKIEEVAAKRKIPLDAIAIKMNNEEALSPMKPEILNAIPEVMKLLEESIKRSKKNDKIIIIGVGNSSGIGNDAKSAIEAEKRIKDYNKKLKAKEKSKRKRIFQKE